MEFETAEEAAEAINTLHLSEVNPSSKEHISIARRTGGQAVQG